MPTKAFIFKQYKSPTRQQKQFTKSKTRGTNHVKQHFFNKAIFCCFAQLNVLLASLIPDLFLHIQILLTAHKIPLHIGYFYLVISVFIARTNLRIIMY